MSPQQKQGLRCMILATAIAPVTYVGLLFLVPLLKPHFPAEFLQPQTDLGMIVLAIYVTGGAISFFFFLKGLHLTLCPSPPERPGLRLIFLGIFLPLGVFMWLQIFIYEASFGELFSGFPGDPPIGLGLLILAIYGLTGIASIGCLLAGILKPLAKI